MTWSKWLGLPKNPALKIIIISIYIIILVLALGLVEVLFYA